MILDVRFIARRLVHVHDDDLRLAVIAVAFGAILLMECRAALGVAAQISTRCAIIGLERDDLVVGIDLAAVRTRL